MKKVFYALALLIVMVTFVSCQKSDASVLGIVSTDETENDYGTFVEVCYSNQSKMYFHLLSDTTAEVASCRLFYLNLDDQLPWVYRGDIVIPHRFVHKGKTYKVTCIGENAFEGRYINDELVSLVSSIELPNTIDTIRDRAFLGCMHLSVIDIPNSVRYIGESAFSGTGLTSISIPDSVKGFGCYVFLGTDLTYVTIPESMDKIPNGMFLFCYKMTAVTLHDHVTTICDDAFRFTGLSSFEIPSSVKYLGVHPLSDCPSLTTLVCYPITPPVKDPNSLFGEDCFLLSDAIERILVPSQSVDLYKESPLWRYYKDIIVGM